jgi:hypothetical protein
LIFAINRGEFDAHLSKIRRISDAGLDSCVDVSQCGPNCVARTIHRQHAVHHFRRFVSKAGAEAGNAGRSTLQPGVPLAFV